MTEWKGQSASLGYGAGRALLLTQEELCPPKKPAGTPQEEKKALQKARKGYQNRLMELAKLAQQEDNPDGSAILLAQLEIAKDDTFFTEVENQLAKEAISAAYALNQIRKQMVVQFIALPDEHLRQRGEDINQVCAELVCLLEGKPRTIFQTPLPEEDYILLAEDLTPAETLLLDKKRLRGIATQKGGPTSHTAILAKQLGVPAVVGIPGLMKGASEGEMALLDGEDGGLVLSPNARQVQQFSEKLLFHQERSVKYKEAEGKPAQTLDGRTIQVCVNSGQETSGSLAISGGDGVGLYRTEFLFLNREEAPSEEAQYTVYSLAVKQAAGKTVTFRTMDIGADKPAPFLHLGKEDNPVLGYRAIRICLQQETLFLTQLRAILRASVHGPVRVMFPMIVNMEELLAAKEMLEMARRQLKEKGQEFAEDIPVGIMVETPAAVFLCANLAAHAQFFSIGTNDLIQYITAADRMNEAVQALCSPFNISVLRAVGMVCEAAARFGVEVSICGEAASEPLLIPVWLGLGVQVLSVAPPLVGRTKFVLSRLNGQQLQKEAQHLLASYGEMAPLQARLQTMATQAGI